MTEVDETGVAVGSHGGLEDAGVMRDDGSGMEAEGREMGETGVSKAGDEERRWVMQDFRTHVRGNQPGPGSKRSRYVDMTVPHL